MSATRAGLRLAGGLHWFWWLGGHVTEGRRWLAEVLAWDAGDDGLAARARALYAVGTLAMIQGDYEEGLGYLDEAVRLAESLGDMVMTGRCRAYKGIIQTYLVELGRVEAAEALGTGDRAASLLEATSDTWGQALAISQLGARARRHLTFDEAERILMRAVALARSTGERYLIGSCLPKLGNLYLEHDDHASLGEETFNQTYERGHEMPLGSLLGLVPEAPDRAAAR